MSRCFFASPAARYRCAVAEETREETPGESLPLEADFAACRERRMCEPLDTTAALVNRLEASGFEPVVDELTFYRAQAVLDGRVVVAGPRQRNHPDFPLRGFVRCDLGGRPLTGSWSKERNRRYAYYHCQRECRAVNGSKAALEGAFVDELALLQPTPGYMRLVKNRTVHVWE